MSGRAQRNRKPAARITAERAAEVMMDKVTRWIAQEFRAAADFDRHPDVKVDWDELRLDTERLLNHTARIADIMTGGK